MAAKVYEGQRILIEMEFRLNGVPTDPTIVTCTYRSPGGTQATLTYPNEALTRRTEGFFEASVLVDEAGTWIIRGEGAGIVDTVNEYPQEVLASGIGT